MDNLQNILYSLLPLVLIIVFSWLFGLLGSRMKKRAASAGNSTTQREEGEDLFDLFATRSGEQPDASQPGMESLPPLPTDAAPWALRRGLTPPSVTADPIKPKMWGA
jgi:hypothetical protein